MRVAGRLATSSRTTAPGTILRDQADYAPPLGVLGQFVGGWVITRQLKRMFTYRHETTRRLVEQGQW